LDRVRGDRRRLGEEGPAYVVDLLTYPYLPLATTQSLVEALKLAFGSEAAGEA